MMGRDHELLFFSIEGRKILFEIDQDFFDGLFSLERWGRRFRDTEGRRDMHPFRRQLRTSQGGTFQEDEPSGVPKIEDPWKRMERFLGHDTDVKHRGFVRVLPQKG